MPVTPDVARRLSVIQREWQRIDPRYLDEDEQRFWATIAGRQIRFDQRAEFARKFAEGRASKTALETFLSTCAAENPNRRLRITALLDRVATPVERADFDDLVTLVTQAPTWEKDRSAGVRVLLRAIGEGKAAAPDQILARWTWRLARATRKVQDRRVSTEFPEAKRLLGAVANSRGHRHEENVNRLVQVAMAMPLPVGAALLASADGYTPRSNGAWTRRGRRSARSVRSRPRSRTTSRRPSSPRASRAAAAASGRARHRSPSSRPRPPPPTTGTARRSRGVKPLALEPAAEDAAA